MSNENMHEDKLYPITILMGLIRNSEINQSEDFMSDWENTLEDYYKKLGIEIVDQS